MELRVLRYFLAVAREETVSQAAEVLHITQPTLSRQLAQMERELGTTLFERRGRRIALTADGLLLRRRAEEILELADRTEQELGRPEEAVEGTVAVGYGEFGAMRRLAECISAFAAENPRVRFSLFCGTADVVKERMDQGLIDIGLLLEPISVEKYGYVRMGTLERQAVFMRADDPLAAKETVAPQDLAGKPLIFPLRYQSQMRNWLGPFFREENVQFINNLPQMGGVLVSMGRAYMIAVQDCLLLRDERILTARPLAGGEEYSSILAWKRGQPLHRVAEKFIAHAKCFLSMDEANK